MSELVLDGQVSSGSLSGTYTTVKSFLYNSVHRKVSKSELAFIAITLAFLQILDGVLTGVGVMTFGTDIEANLIIKTLMINFGVFTALVAVKSFALVVIAALCSMVNKITWLAAAMKCIIVLYIFAAIIPWIMILSFNAA